MHKYRVIENFSGKNWVLLEGGVGRYHWVRVLTEVPRVGEVYSGSRPHLGFGLLYGLRSGAPLRVIFETINETDRGFNLAWLPEAAAALTAGRAGR